MNQKILDAIERVYAKTMALSQKEFDKKIEAHQNGEFAKILLEINAFSDDQLDAYENVGWVMTEGNLLVKKETPRVSITDQCYSSDSSASIPINENEKERTEIEEDRDIWTRLAA